MPINKNAYTRYRIIDATLRSRKFVKTRELVEKFEDIYDLNVGETTINKDIRDMINDSRLGFYAPISYCHKEKAYCYPENVEEIFPAIELQEEEINALTFYANTLTQYKNLNIFKDFTNAIDKVVDAVKIQSSQRRVSEQIIIQPENFQQFQGSELIPQMISGFDTNMKFGFNYQKHTSEDKKEHIVTPILLREYEHLWYLLAKRDGKDYITTFALDRISDFNILDTIRDEIHGFDPDRYFDHSFGIAVTNGSVEDVILEFESWRGKYLLSSPIHKSQRLLEEENGKMIFSFKVIPFHELHSKILSYGSAVKVLEPESLRLKIQELLQETLRKY